MSAVSLDPNPDVPYSTSAVAARRGENQVMRRKVRLAHPLSANGRDVGRSQSSHAQHSSLCCTVHAAKKMGVARLSSHFLMQSNSATPSRPVVGRARWLNYISCSIARCNGVNSSHQSQRDISSELRGRPKQPCHLGPSEVFHSHHICRMARGNKDAPPPYPDQYSAQPPPPAPQPPAEYYVVPPQYRRRRPPPPDDPGLICCLVLLAFIVPFWVVGVKEGCTGEFLLEETPSTQN